LFWLKQNSFETVLFQFCFSFISIVQTVLVSSSAQNRQVFVKFCAVVQQICAAENVAFVSTEAQFSAQM